METRIRSRASMADGWSLVHRLARPLFVAELIRQSGPDLTFGQQAFAMRWMLITVPRSLAARVCLLSVVVTLFVTLYRRCAINTKPDETMMILAYKRRLANGAVLVLCIGGIACSRSRSERWIIPAGYVGWLRLDYSVKGAVPLPIENGRYVVRLPSSGRIATSTVNDPKVDNNEYYVQGSGGFGLRRLHFGWPPVPGYAVQNAYGQGNVSAPAHVLEGPHVNIEFECLFVGTRSEFSTNGRNCSAWNNGDPQPPKSPPQPTLHGPSMSGGPTGK